MKVRSDCRAPQGARSRGDPAGAARRLDRALRRDGFDGTSVQSIVEQANVTKGGFYHHFASKQALLHEIHDRFIDFHLERMRELLAIEDLPADELLRRLVRDISSTVPRAGATTSRSSTRSGASSRASATRPCSPSATSSSAT